MGIIRFARRRGFAGKRLPLLLAAATAVVALLALAWFGLYGGQVGRAASVTVIGGTITSESLASGQVHVIDGDTIRVAGRPYRLVGFDTPESGPAARLSLQAERNAAPPIPTA